MCNRYVSPAEGDIERHWNLRHGQTWAGGEIFPRAPGAFIRAQQDGKKSTRELVVGQWGLIPWFSKTPILKYSTNNARYEELSAKASYKQPWAKGQRCIIPAVSFDEPCWETGRNVWWRFRRADAKPWGLAGLWATWVDKASGEVNESYTMLTLNADAHPIMKRMHKPDPKLGPDQQDKRSVIAIESADVDQWLMGTLDEAAKVVRLPDPKVIDAGPVSETRGAPNKHKA
jgi:putative SOS response-associated peptidase YedK